MRCSVLPQRKTVALAPSLWPTLAYTNPTYLSDSNSSPLVLYLGTDTNCLRSVLIRAGGEPKEDHGGRRHPAPRQDDP
eukprot:950305-Rhodomonas_salina.1